MTRSSFVWQERFAGRRGLRQGLALERRAGQSLHRGRGERRRVAAHDGDRLRAVRRGGDDRARAVARDVEGISDAGARDEPGHLDGARHQGRGRPAGRIFYHSGNNGRRFTSYMTGDIAQAARLRLLHRARPTGRRWSTALGLARVRRRAPARHRADFDRYDDPRLVAAAVGGARGGRARGRGGAGAAASDPREPGDPAVLRRHPGSSARSSPGEASPRSRSRCSARPSPRPRTPPALTSPSAGRWSRPAISRRRSRRIGRARALEGDRGEAQRQIRWARGRGWRRARVPSPSASRRWSATWAGTRSARSRCDPVVCISRAASSPSPRSRRWRRICSRSTADPTIRIRFVGGGAGPAPGIVAIYSDGTIDEWPRSR